MKKKCMIFSLVFCLTMLLSMPLLADGILDQTVNAAVSNEPITDILTRLRDERANLVSAQTEVMIQANEAKLRVEIILTESIEQKKALTAEQLESLKKDLETIKSAQDILNSVLTDIRNTATNYAEFMPSREYLYTLIKLYSEKSLQLYDVAKALEYVAAGA